MKAINCMTKEENKNYDLPYHLTEEYQNLVRQELKKDILRAAGMEV